MKPWVVIVGPPGAGKSTVGRLLAAATGRAFRDADADVEAVAGKPVADIFVEDGEPAFRALERTAVLAALDGYDGVLALGGGAVLDASVRSRLAEHTVVFLDVSLTDAAARVGLNQSRPLLAVNPRAELARMLDERRPLYTEVATVTVDTSGQPAETVASMVQSALGAG